MGEFWTLLFIQVILIALNTIFASAEIAVLMVNQNKLAKLSADGNKRAKCLLKLTSQPERFLATIQVAITLAGFLGSAFAAENFSDALVELMLSVGMNFPRKTLDTIAVIFITLVLSYFTLVFGELVPKRIAMKKSEQIALGVSGLISFISKFFKPVVWLLSVSTNAVIKLCGIDPNQTDGSVSKEEIRLLLDEGNQKGVIKNEEKDFIQNVFRFNELTAGELATHRTDVYMLWMEDGVQEWTKIVYNSRHTMYPICEGSPDHIIGVLNAKDYYRLEDKSIDNIIKNAVRPAYFVPEAIRADMLLRNMKKTKNMLAVVLDEYGGMFGIITINDLVEALVGDLSSVDDGQTSRSTIEKIDEYTWNINGSATLRDIDEALGTTWEATANCDTITGYVFDLLGSVPDDGEQNIELKIENFIIVIRNIHEHQIISATIQLQKENMENEA